MSASNRSRTAASATRLPAKAHTTSLTCRCVGLQRLFWRQEGGFTHPLAGLVLPGSTHLPLSSPTLPLLLLLKSGLQHGNENCHPVPAAIMEFRGGRRRLNHNGIKEAWEGARSRAGGTVRREEGYRLHRFRQGLVILSRHGFYWGGKGNRLVPKDNTCSVSILSAAVIQEKSKRAAEARVLRKLWGHR